MSGYLGVDRGSLPFYVKLKTDSDNLYFIKSILIDLYLLSLKDFPRVKMSHALCLIKLINKIKWYNTLHGMFFSWSLQNIFISVNCKEGH